MKSLFVDAHLFDGFGQGTKTYLGGLYSSVIKKKHDLDISFAAVDIGALKREFGSHPNVHYLPFTGKNKFVRLAIDIPSLIRKNKMDAAHFQYVSPAIKTCDEIVTVHDILFRDFPQFFPLSYRLVKDFLFRRSARRADWVLTVSEYSKEALIRHYGIQPEKIVITPNGVLNFFLDDSTGTVPSAIPSQPFILYVSRFEPRKNQAGLLKAFLDLELWRKGIQLVLIGTPGVYSAEFESLYAGLAPAVKSNVLILRDIPISELKEFYRKSLLFVYPSFAEGFGIPPLEAAACGANVLCSGATAMKEFSFLGDRLFDPANNDEFRDKILYYLDHAPSAKEAADIKSFVETNYSWDWSADSYISAVLNR